jgi:8-oxo-dGTP pyrophosphatase MutT (NUDIX family)
MIQKFRFFAEIRKFCKFQKFLKFNESVVDTDESEVILEPSKAPPQQVRGDNAFSKFRIMKPWKLLDSEFLVDAPWLKVAKETCELPSGKVIDDFYTLWQPDWVLILARTKEGKWVMTEQYRHGTGKIALEFPAGIIDKGETPEEAAVRELQEECGYGVKGASGTQYVGSFSVNPDRHRGKFHVVFIDGVERLGKTSFDDTEDIETFLYTDEEFQAKVADGTFNHPLQIAGYFKWKLSQSASRF